MFSFRTNHERSNRFNYYLNGVHIVSNNNKLSFLLLNQGGYSIDTLADNKRTLGGSVGFAFSSCLSPSPQSLLLGQFAFRTVLVEELEQLGSYNYKRVNRRPLAFEIQTIAWAVPVVWGFNSQGFSMHIIASL